MNPMTAQYIGFVVVALILIWAVIELNRRISRRRLNERRPTQGPWLSLNPRRVNDEEAAPVSPQPDSAESEDAFEDSDAEIHTRAKQNGHYSESKKPS